MNLTENCVVVGVSTAKDDDVLRLLQEGLTAVQHRGQESVDISVYKGELKNTTSMGLMSESKIFQNKIKAPVGISHERYSTAGRSTSACARSAATGYAMASGILLREVFQVDKYQYQRIFVMPDQAVRERKASKKLNVLPSIAKGKVGGSGG